MLELGRFPNQKDPVGRLERTLKWLQAALRDMDRRQTNDESSKLWVQELKELAYDVEDLLDEFEYEDLRRKVEGVSSSSGNQASGFSELSTENLQVRELLSPSSPHDRFSDCHSTLHRIVEIQRRLDDVTKIRNDLRLDVGELSVYPHDRPTCSLMTKVFGMEKEKEEMVEFLLESSSDHSIGASTSSANVVPHTHVSVAAIVGMGGIGKTTLAQSAYNDERVQRHFDQRIWLWVSDDLSMQKLTKHMLEHFGDDQTNLSIENLNVLQERLRDRLRGKRFLLVLDNVWDEDYDKWGRIHALLMKGGQDSKVIITTRNTKVSTVVRTSKTIKLKGLEPEHCWSVLKSCGFKDGDAEEHPTLEAIGRKIVEKLHGVPLAARTVGGLLYGKLDEEQWKEVLESELWKFERGEGSIVPALWLRYEHLPLPLKRCFAYCSLFPKDCIFNKNDLVNQWIAHGFVHTHGRKRMEDVGSDYFDDLLGRSFFQLVDGKHVMHNLLHELAQLVSEANCLYIGMRELKKVESYLQDLRHLFLSVTKKRPDLRGMEKLHTCSRLRTIMFYSRNKFRYSIPNDLFINFTYVRVLVLWDYGLEILPSSINELVHLRYLDLSDNPIKVLPSSLCRMYRLQTLKLNGCDQLVALPSSMSSLINLRHLEAEAGVISMMVGIGRLLSLQELEVFSISRGDGINIGDLNELNELRGKLCIGNLQRVMSKQEASTAKLKNKLHVKMLELEWGEDGDSDRRSNIIIEEIVLESLQPPPNLKELTIRCYGGVKCPAWMQYQSISRLESICLHQCRRWNALPSLGWLPSLTVLSIAHCPHLKELPTLPKTLSKLTLKDSGLTSLSRLTELQLQELEISDNLELREVSQLPMSLRQLEIKNIPLLDSLPTFGRCPDATEGDCPSLSSLKIQRCPHLTSLREGLLQHHLQALRALRVIDCGELAQWPEGEVFLATLRSLEEELTVEGCPKLEALPEGCSLSSSLKKLAVKGCPLIASTSLFIQLHNLTSEGVYVENKYQYLASCCEEALQQLRELEMLEMSYVIRDNLDDDVDVVLKYDRKKAWSKGCDHYILARRLVIEIRSNPRNCKSIEGSLFRCLQSCHASCASSLRWLIITGFSHKELTYALGGGTDPMPPFCFDSIIALVMKRCGGIKKMPETLLRHLSSMRELSISDSPEMAFSSLEAGIRSLRYLRRLVIQDCPKLLTAATGGGGGGGSGVMTRPISSSFLSSCASSSSTEPPRVLLESVSMDGFQLISDQHFVHNHLTSLKELCFWHCKFTSFTMTAEAAAGLRSVQRTVEVLEFWHCPDLLHLPPELESLFPSLKCLQIEDCPSIRCMPRTGLPASLETLEIVDCPILAKRCQRSSREDEEDSNEEDGTEPSGAFSDWEIVARIPHIEIDGRIIQGSPQCYD